MSLLFPTKMKFKKYQKQKGRFKGLDTNYCFPKRGFYALKAVSCKRIKSNHIEAVRRYVHRRIKRKLREKLQICIFPDLPVTKKSSGIRMGKGKGGIDYWCTTIFAGRVLFELGKSVKRTEALWTLLKSGSKLPLRSRVILRKKFHLE